MHKKPVVILFISILVLLGMSSCFSVYLDEENPLFEGLSEEVEISSMVNYNNMNSIFSEKINDYTTYGFFPQMYESSLQATYYGVYILDAIGKRDRLNATQIINYIMSTYNISTHIFMDKYAYRYLDIDFTQETPYFPLTSILEVNCYAILSLQLLNALDLIDIDSSIDFLWSCYNPLTSGFIGQLYNPSLDYYAKISTMDNTYFAIKTLDLLMDDWVPYTQERNDLIQFINSLQVTDEYDSEFGGFMNDYDMNFRSLRLYTDTNIFSSYYCIKSLELFGMVGSINYASFYTFLEELYVTDKNYFQYIVFGEPIETNIVTTTIGLDLSRITGFSSYNETATTDFVFNNRNSLGIWDGSTDIQYHELIDTFQIVRALKDCNLLPRLTFADTNLIASTVIDYYLGLQSFSLISIDYPTLNLLNTIITSFDIYGRLSELDLQELYLKINQTYYLVSSYRGFYGLTNLELIGNLIQNFRSYPIEFYTEGKKTSLKDIEYRRSHKTTFYALNSLQKIFKLDDFALTHNLTTLLNYILTTQFLK